MNRGTWWWISTAIVWALLPLAVELVARIASELPAEPSRTLLDVLAWSAWFWVVLGIVAAIVTARTAGRRIGAALVVLAAAALVELLGWGLASWGAGIGWGIVLIGPLVRGAYDAIALAGIVTGFLVALGGPRRTLWAPAIAFVLVAASLYAVLYSGGMLWLGWGFVILPIVAALLAALAFALLARDPRARGAGVVSG